MKKWILFPYKLLLAYTKLFSRKRLYKLMFKAIKQYYQTGAAVVSIGSGGKIKKVLVDNGVDFKEIDIDPDRKPDYVLSMEDMHLFEDNSIDMIFCMEVLEHVSNPFNALQETERILKPGGIFVGSTPFVFPIHDEPYDFYRYTKYGLRHLFEQFEELQIEERNSYIESIYVIFLRLLNIGKIRQRIVGILFFPLFLILLPFVLLFSLLVDNYQSTTGYFFVFRKK